MSETVTTVRDNKKSVGIVFLPRKTWYHFLCFRIRYERLTKIMPRKKPAANDNRVSALSLKTLKCDPRLGKDATSKSLCYIYGRVNSIKTQSDRTRGEIFTTLIGSFEGINTQDPSAVLASSSKAFLPGGIQEAVEAVVKDLKKGEGAYVQFGFHISSVKADNALGYGYTAKKVIAPGKRDELADIRTAFAAAIGKPIDSKPPAPKS